DVAEQRLVPLQDHVVGVARAVPDDRPAGTRPGRRHRRAGGGARRRASGPASHFRTPLAAWLGPSPPIGQLVPGPVAAIAGRVVVAADERVAATMAAMTSRVVASLCFTRLPFSAVRRTRTVTYPCRSGGGSVLDLLRRGAP